MLQYGPFSWVAFAGHGREFPVNSINHYLGGEKFPLTASNQGKTYLSEYYPYPCPQNRLSRTWFDNTVTFKKPSFPFDYLSGRNNVLPDGRAYGYKFVFICRIQFQNIVIHFVQSLEYGRTMNESRIIQYATLAFGKYLSRKTSVSLYNFRKMRMCGRFPFPAKSVHQEQVRFSAYPADGLPMQHALLRVWERLLGRWSELNRTSQ